MVPDRKKSFQQRRFSTLDNRFERCFHQGKAYFDLVLHNVDWHTMHPFSSDFCSPLQAVDARIKKGGLVTEYRDDSAFDAIHLLHFKFQVDIRSDSIQIPIP